MSAAGGVCLESGSDCVLLDCLKFSIPRFKSLNRPQGTAAAASEQLYVRAELRTSS